MKGTTRWVFGTDNHGDQADNSVVDAFIEFVKFWKPTVRIHGGDCFDMRCLRKNASEQETRDSPGDDIEAGLSFVGRFKPTHYLRGNHDERLWDAAGGDDGKLSTFAGYCITDIEDALGSECQMFPYDKRLGVMKFGDHSFIHGYNGGIYAARHSAAAYGSVIHGHNHADDIQSVPRIDSAVGHSIGALCKLSQIYNRAQIGTLRQSNGFAYGIEVRGQLVVWHAKRVAGKFYLPSEIREIA